MYPWPVDRWDASFLDGTNMLTQDFIHGKHVHAILLEDGAHSVVAADLTFVVWILQVSRFHVLPDLLYGLRARELCFA